MPSKRPATTGPSQEQWQANQEFIFRGWFGGMALDPGLIDHMTTSHQFTASKGQYERKFTEWGWKKNLTAADLQYVLARIHERETAGKKSVATFENGAFKMIVPSERLRKGKYRPGKVAVHSFDIHQQGISVHTPPTIDDGMGAIEYTLSHPHHGTISLTASKPFVARGKATKRQRIRSPSPINRIVNVPQLLLVVRNINTRKLPIFDFLDFIESPELHRGIMASDQASIYSDISIFDLEDDGNDLTSEISRDVPNLKFCVPAVSEPFMYEFFAAYFPSPHPSNATDLRIALLKHLGPLIIERYDGDLEYRISRLLGPNDTDTFFEFLAFVMHTGANSEMHSISDIEDILSWFVRQNKRILEIILALPFATMHAFLDFVILRTTQSHTTSCVRPNSRIKRTLEGDGAKALLDLDIHHRLFAGNVERKLVVAIQLSHIGLVGALLKQGVNPNYLGSGREYASPLHQACQNGEFQIVKQLVRGGADLNPSMTLSRYTHAPQEPFQWALERAERGETDVLRYFLEQGARPISGKQIYTSNLQNHRILRQNNIDYRFEPEWHDFMSVVIAGEEDDVAEYITSGVNVNNNLSLKLFEKFPRGYLESATFAQNSGNCTVLQAAVENRHSRIVKILLKSNVNVNAAIYSCHGWSALEIAHSTGQTDIVAELSKHGAMFNSTPMADRVLVEAYNAIEAGDIQAIRELFQQHKVDYMDLLDLTWEHTLMRPYPSRGQLHVKREVLQMIRDGSSGDINMIGPRTKRCVLELAVRLGVLEYATHLYKLGARFIPDMTCDSSTLLQSVAKQAQRGADCSKLVQMMLELGALADEPDLYNGYDAFKAAIWAGVCQNNINLEPAQLILEAGLNVNARPWCDPKDMFDWWTIYYGSGLSEDHSPLQILIHAYSKWPGIKLKSSKVNNIASMVEYLVLQGADLNAPPSQVVGSGTPLQLSIAIYGHNPEVGFDIIRQLIRVGADVNSPAGDFGETAIQSAVHHPVLMEFLLENGANINAPAAKINGRTSLQKAAEWGYIKIVKRLLELGADPNAPGAEVDGYTALEAAGRAGHLDTVVLLLDNGAVATEKAVQIVQDSNFFAIAKIILGRVGGTSNGSGVEAGLIGIEGIDG